VRDDDQTRRAEEAGDETIVAISTPRGRGGIGIVRLSGVRARAIAEPLLRLKRPLEAGRARFAEILDLVAEDGSARVLDEGVVTFFAAPRSYTGEDVVEIAAHGSPVVLEYLLRQCCAIGARLAEPGEFTERAFLAGRLDLTQAEAVEDLIASSTLEQARTAARQLGGGLARIVGPVKRELVELIAGLEAGIDFAEDDIDLMPGAAIEAKIRGIAAPLQELEETFRYGRILREGFRLAIVGRPNAGKSSLFNRLVGRDRAIVTAEPGTTRDPIEAQVEMAGIPVELVDTAGLRTGENEAERMGIARSREAMAEADVVLLVLAADEAAGEEELAVLGVGAQASRVIVVLNKVDLCPAGSVAAQSLSEDYVREAVRTCAVTGVGVEELRAAILGRLEVMPGGGDSAMLTNLRQHEAVAKALGALAAARGAVRAGTPHEMVLLDLYEGLQGLDLLTGTTTNEDVLREIFSTFCIGK
jgi:tRNA modification GTPase